MNTLRRKLAQILTDAVKKGIDALDPFSPYAEELKKTGTYNIIREDIDKICETISAVEVAKILSFSARLRAVPEKKRGPIKDELKKIAQDVVARTEVKLGKLKTPERYRRLLLKL